MAENRPGGQPAPGVALPFSDLSEKDLRVWTVGEFDQLAPEVLLERSPRRRCACREHVAYGIRDVAHRDRCHTGIVMLLAAVCCTTYRRQDRTIAACDRMPSVSCLARLVALTRLPSKQLEWFVNLSRSVPIVRSGSPPPLHSRRQRRLDASQRDAVARAYTDGESMATLARAHGVRRETISKIIRDAAVELRPQRGISHEQITEAAGLYRRGWSLARLAERYGFDGQTIHTHLKRAGVVMRGPHDWRGLS